MSSARTITFFEHEVREFAWTERDLAALERLQRTTGVEVLRATVREGKRSLQAAQHVGVVRLHGRTIQVLPKIYRWRDTDSERNRTREATRNLLYLLAYAGQLPIREQAIAPLLQQDSDWFEILTRLFAAHLLEEWQRGAHRNYQTIEGELPLLRGKWRIADQLRRPERRHIFAVAYDEFTADNPLNRVLRFVVERLWCLTRDANNRQWLGELRQWMEEVTLPPVVTAAAARSIPLTRLNQRYTPLINLAALFLEGGALQLASGDQSTFAFVFDMNRLFEGFVVNFIRRHRDEILPPALQDCELLSQSQRASVHLAWTAGRPVFRLHPDLAFRSGKLFPLLLDAKYKRLNPADVASGVSEADFYQMHAYAHCYDCPRVVLLYPQMADMSQSLNARFTLEDSATVIVAATVDLRVQLDNSDERRKLAETLQAILHRG